VPEGFGVEFSHMSRITRDFETQLCVYSVLAVNLLSAKKSKSKVIVPARTSPSLITFQFHALDINLISTHLLLKGLKRKQEVG